MWAMWGRRLWGRGTQRQDEQCHKDHEASSREEETLRNDQRTSLQCRSDQERRPKDGTSERNHSNTIHTVRSDTQKRAAVHSDANHLAPRSKKPRIVETTSKREEAGVRNPGRIEVVQKAYQDDEVADQVYSADYLAARMCRSSVVGPFQPTFPSNEHSRTGTDGDSLLRENLMVASSSKSSSQTSSLPAMLPRSSVKNGAFQTANERLKQEFDPPLSRQPCSKGDAAADARIQKLEQELHILEKELKNQNQDEKMDVDAVHYSTREATASPNGTYRARRTTIV
jgi:hypothetical protein